MSQLRNSFYYRIKPLVPAQFRLAMRGWLARRKRERVSQVWPVLPGSDLPPKGWPGWPMGKKFAFVLTHDVEGPGGLERCRKLMELEMKWGFRSSFNFVPEGTYCVSKELREELTRNGFEVGVHDFHHDGSLYKSRHGFASSAAGINRYLKDWGAVGFRSGFMFHNLGWLQDLEIQYDASTFDTDPFEPQPDAARTIFPFWIEGLNGRGYAELPYTLVQDSTLFLLMRERTPTIWQQKSDWVAERGGMVLVNLHPDYVAFDGDAPNYRQFPMTIYEQFLKFIRDKYADTMWHVLPKEVAAYVAQIKPRLPYQPKRVCMVTHSNFLADARVTRYAEALAERGDHVDVISLDGCEAGAKPASTKNVNIVPLKTRIGKKETSPLSHLLPLMRFFGAASSWIFREHWRNPYDIFHIHNVPDFLVFTALYPKLTGAKIILDIHDIVPEFYISKFGGDPNSLTQTTLRLMERWSAQFSDHVIISNDLWRKAYAARTGMSDHCSVFINNVDMNIFRPRPRQRQDGKFIMIFPGGLQWHQGVDIALRAFQKVALQAPQAEFHIYGEGNMKGDLIKLTQELGLNGKVRFFDPVPVRTISGVMAEADLGVVPKRANGFGNEAYSTKIMEFMSLGIPVVISSTTIDRFYFNDRIARFFEAENVDALAEAILEMIRQPEQRRAMAARASEYAVQNSWASRKAEYLALVDRRLSRPAQQNDPVTWLEPNKA